MEIGKIIKENRSSKNMTQEDLAKEFFVSRQLISKWENGKSYPDLEQLLKLSTFFDLTLDELMRGDKEMTKNLNTIIQRKNLFKMIISILLIVIGLFSYFIWTERTVQLKPEDIEIISIKTTPNPSAEILNSNTGEKVVLPSDVSYTIKYKIKRPLMTVRTGYYLGQDNANLYLDFRGKRTLFNTNKEYSFSISSDYQIYNKNNVELTGHYIQSIMKNKNIKIFELTEKFNGDNFSDMKNWLLIDKTDLNTN